MKKSLLTLAALVAFALGAMAQVQISQPSPMNLSQWIGSTAPTVGSKTSANSIPFVLASDNTGPVLGPALTKGTQAATGFSTQDLKDAGRTIVTLTADNVVPILTTDTAVTFTKLVGDTSTATQTTYAVTSGKTLRITNLTFTMVPSSTTVALLRVRLRTLSSGACLAGSTLVGVWALSTPPGTIAANAGGVATSSIPFPDGLEFSGANRNVCLSANVLGAASQTVTITVTGFEY